MKNLKNLKQKKKKFITYCKKKNIIEYNSVDHFMDTCIYNYFAELYNLETERNKTKPKKTKITKKDKISYNQIFHNLFYEFHKEKISIKQEINSKHINTKIDESIKEILITKRDSLKKFIKPVSELIN